MVGRSLARGRARRSSLFVASSVLLGIALSAAPVVANHGLYRHVSAGIINGNGAFAASLQGASADGTRVFFTTGERLVSGDTDNINDIYQRSGGTLSRVSVGAINGNGNFSVTFMKATPDGTRVYFITQEQLVAGDSDAAIDVYQRSGGSTTRVSTGAINGNGNFPAQFNGVSNDGSRVFFSTAEKLVSSDTDTAADIYMRSGGTTTRISVGAINGNQNAFPATYLGASTNGQRVFFTTTEQLVAADTDAQPDIYERFDGATTLVSRGAINGNGLFPATFNRSSSDGTRVIFTTAEQLVAGDTDSQPDVYERSSGSTKRVSAGATNGNGAFAAQFVGSSADATRVFFASAEQLVGADNDGALDIYQRASGTTSRISAGAVNGNGNFAANFLTASADGTRVLFMSNEQLAGGDTDAKLDIYQRSGGTTTWISAGQINGNLPYDAGYVGASADAKHVFFYSQEPLASSDGDAVLDLFERFDGQTSQISIGNGLFPPTFKFASKDGSRVFYETYEQVLASDVDAVPDIYGAYDLP